MPKYRSVSGSAAEDLFIELFSDAFGAEKTLFRVSILPAGRITLEFWIELILKNLPDGWTDERLRSVLKNMPHLDSNCLREFEHAMTIDLPALYDEENLEAFKQALKTIMEA